MLRSLPVAGAGALATRRPAEVAPDIAIRENAL
jgi:hypothetical protein